MYVTALFVIAQNWKQPKPLSNEEGKNKLWFIHIRDYSGMKRNEVLTQATTQMNLENIMLHERNQSQKVTYCTSSLMKCPEKANSWR